MRPKDLTGQIVNNLEYIENTGKKLNGSYIWKIKCHCGNIFEKIIILFKGVILNLAGVFLIVSQKI